MKMINVGSKKVTQREAIVEARVTINPKVIQLIKKDKLSKGNVLEAAKVAGIIAAKRTPLILPLCHPISIEYATIDCLIKKEFISVLAIVKGEAKTGVEMEAFTAATVAALTIYDMCKGLDRGIVISEIKLLKKRGGKSGDYER